MFWHRGTLNRPRRKEQTQRTVASVLPWRWERRRRASVPHTPREPCLHGLGQPRRCRLVRNKPSAAAKPVYPRSVVMPPPCQTAPEYRPVPVTVSLLGHRSCAKTPSCRLSQQTSRRRKAVALFNPQSSAMPRTERVHACPRSAKRPVLRSTETFRRQAEYMLKRLPA